ncbi:MAG: response regulator transcription factor [Lachnospirales bacterium]
MDKILIVEDDINILQILDYNLKNAGFETTKAKDGREGLDCAKSDTYDLILLDVNMPYIDGFELCGLIREFSNVPIIMLTAKAEESDKITGLSVGADDYVTKPFSINEVIARVKAHLRRNTILSTDKKDDSDFLIDEDKVEVRIKGVVMDFTPLEYKVIKYLYDNKPRVISREELLQEVWGYKYLSDERTVDVTIRRLRTKIEAQTSENLYLYTKRGSGYFFEDIKN